MPTPTEFWNWRHTDDRGRRRVTRWKLTRADALATLRDPEPVEASREVRLLPNDPSEHQTPGDFLKNSQGAFFQPADTPDEKDPPTP